MIYRPTGINTTVHPRITRVFPLTWPRSLQNDFKKWCHVTSAQSYPIRSQYSRNLPQPDFLQDAVWTWVVKRASSRFNSFCYNVSKQVALFCCPFYRCLRWRILTTLFIQFTIFTLPIIQFVCTPKFCITIVYFLLGMTVVRRGNKDNILAAKFCGANNVHHGQCENGILGKSWRSK